MIIKVCGMRDAENIREVETTGADLLGFIFYPKSPRFVSRANDAILNCSLKKVGVFVNSSIEEIKETIDLYKLSYVQLHGNESPEFCEKLKDLGMSIFKAFPIESPKDLAETEAYEGSVDYFLFDTKCTEYGGSGKQFDWTVLEKYKGKTPFFLSGGLKPESLDDLLKFHHPRMAGIDINSGFEIAPAMKNSKQLRDFITEFKNQKND